MKVWKNTPHGIDERKNAFLFTNAFLVKKTNVDNLKQMKICKYVKFFIRKRYRSRNIL